MKMVQDWKSGWKWFSVHIAAMIAILNALVASLSYLQEIITPTQFASANAVLGILVIMARLINQQEA